MKLEWPMLILKEWKEFLIYFFIYVVCVPVPHAKVHKSKIRMIG